MPFTEQQQAEIKQEFAARRRRQTLLAIPLVLFMLVAVMMRAGISVDGGSMEWFGPVFLTVVLGAVAFSLINWRCPACRGFLGREPNPRFCSKCGTELH